MGGLGVRPNARVGERPAFFLTLETTMPRALRYNFEPNEDSNGDYYEAEDLQQEVQQAVLDADDYEELVDELEDILGTRLRRRK